MKSRLVTGPSKHPTRTSFTAWTTIVPKQPETATLEQLGGDMLFVLAGLLAGLLGVEPTRLFIGVGVAPDPAEQNTPGAPLHFRVELSLDGVKLGSVHAHIVKARLRKSLPAFRRVAEAS